MALTVESYLPGAKESQSSEATRVVIKDEYGNPLILAVEYGKGYFVSHVNDPDFEQLIQTFGYQASAKSVSPGSVSET